MLRNKTQVETVNFRLHFKVIIRISQIIIVPDDDFEIKSKVLRLICHILHSQDDFL